MPVSEAVREFDLWREHYDSLTFQDQQAFYRRLAVLYPCQQSFSLYQAGLFFQRYRPRSVVELGGWDGALANHILAGDSRIEWWHNYDLVEVPQACVDDRYMLHVLSEPFQAATRSGDAFVATHTIEHLKEHEIREVVARLKFRVCLIEAPLNDRPTDWTGYFGSHILDVGWARIDQVFSEHGYRVDHEWPSGRFYRAD